MPINLIKSTANKFEDESDAALTIMLIIGAAIIAGVAIFSHSKILKAIVLAYIVLP